MDEYADKGEHPITKLVSFLQREDEAAKAVLTDTVSIPKRKQQADDLLILNSRPGPATAPPARWTIPLDRASDFLIPIGSEVAGVGENRIHSWQQDDE
jgi:hypothetical protein